MMGIEWVASMVFDWEASMVYWILAMVFFIIVELATAALVAIWFVAGSIAAFVAACFDVSLVGQCVVFTVVSVVLFLLMWPFLGKVKVEKTPTNADSVVGMEGIVLDDIDNVRSLGRVQVNGLGWAARSEDGSLIEAGKRIVVRELQGVTLTVSEKK
ncbi:MAG: NfeD family protein [Planctomycetia bacterium]|nr:NfeD family protein [Planctomycetia bacterium]